MTSFDFYLAYADTVCRDCGLTLPFVIDSAPRAMHLDDMQKVTTMYAATRGLRSHRRAGQAVLGATWRELLLRGFPLQFREHLVECAIAPVLLRMPHYGGELELSIDIESVRLACEMAYRKAGLVLGTPTGVAR